MVIYETKGGADYGSFDSQDVAKGEKDQVYSRNIVFTKGQYQEPPEFAIGFDFLHADTAPGENLRYLASIDLHSDGNGFRAISQAWNVATLERARMTWVERKPSAKNTQFGVWETFLVKSGSSNSQRINFKVPFDVPPVIVLWLKKVDLRRGGGWKVGLYPMQIDNDGFVLHAETWGGGEVYAVKASWIAIKQGQRVIDSGRFAPPSTRGKEQPEKEQYVKFVPGRFSKPPTVITGLSTIDLPDSKPAKIESVVKNVTKDGFTWKLDHDSKFMNNAYFIAIPS
ncbi:hypothetical protein AMS68_005165 [Peltaster fructicola]|uniref:H-type lectin domain-containing protein n=1 Tax=Peltaster fructicola TaxID=286661 RepID=A0A6H0XYH7_9PEZI|nr:hypothetical protein AMS68_005165 [Peltaster fructicola]